ncbi:MAG: tetratricopeptide repeat protein [Clostridia bacterium]
MSILISVVIAIILVFALGYLAPMLPLNNLLGGNFYQIIGIILAILISALLNLPMLYMFRGNSCYKKGQYKEAVNLYKKAYKTKRLSVDMEIYCGYILIKEGDMETGEKILTEVSQKKLNDRQKNSLDANMAILLWKKGELDSAIDLLQSLWERCESVNVAGTLGALMLLRAREDKNYEKPLEFCTQANKKFTYEKTILANLGECYYSMGENEKAIKTFEELMDCGTTSPTPFYYYGCALLKADRREEGKEMFNHALRLRFTNLSTISKKTIKSALEEIERAEDTE